MSCSLRKRSPAVCAKIVVSARQQCHSSPVLHGGVEQGTAACAAALARPNAVSAGCSPRSCTVATTAGQTLSPTSCSSNCHCTVRWTSVTGAARPCNCIQKPEGHAPLSPIDFNPCYQSSTLAVSAATMQHHVYQHVYPPGKASQTGFGTNSLLTFGCEWLYTYHASLLKGRSAVIALLLVAVAEEV